MADYVPFVPSDNNYRLGVAYDDVRVFFDTRWNSRDSAWYFDLRAEDDTPIILNVKVLLGVNLLQRCRHDFAKAHRFSVVDTSNKNLDAGYDDLGARVQVSHVTADEVGAKSFR